MWNVNLSRGLLWRTDRHRDLVVGPMDCFRQYLAPSWSWASQPMTVWGLISEAQGYQRNEYYESIQNTYATIVEAWCRPMGCSAFGALQDGQLVVDAYVCDVLLAVSEWHGRQQIQDLSIQLENGAVIRLDRQDERSLDWPVSLVRQKTPSNSEVDILLQDKRSANGDLQLACSGYVCLCRLFAGGFLILANSQKCVGAYERLGVLGFSTPLSPDLNKNLEEVQAACSRRRIAII